jgi:hypothetical protein
MADWLEQLEAFEKDEEWKPTQLPPEKEAEFRRWLTNTEWFKEIKGDIASQSGRTPNDEELFEELVEQGDYDYRGAWASGAAANERDSGDGKLHWPSSTGDGRMLKSPRHETAWKEFFMRSEGVDPEEMGIKTIEQARKYQEERRKSAPYQMYPSMR